MLAHIFALHLSVIEAVFLRSTAGIDGSLFRLQVLRSDSLKLMERELFIYFFTDPPRLKRTIAELSARVDAQIVSLKWRMWVSSIMKGTLVLVSVSVFKIRSWTVQTESWYLENYQNHLFSFPELVEVKMKDHILKKSGTFPNYKINLLLHELGKFPRVCLHLESPWVVKSKI